MNEMSDGERYTPLFEFHSELPEDVRFLCFDVAKTNLFWLVEPRIDAEGVMAAHKNPIAAAIDKYMDQTTRLWLQKTPKEFTGYWLKADNGTTALSEDWPSNYRSTMAKRAAEAQARLLGRVESGNVVTVNFRRAQ